MRRFQPEAADVAGPLLPLLPRVRIQGATHHLLFALLVLIPAVAAAQSALTNGAAVAEKPSTSVAGSLPGFAGSSSCRECHAKFYTLWSTSFHGLAMQPYTETLAKEKLSPQQGDVIIGKNRYRAEIGSGGGYVLETGHVTLQGTASELAGNDLVRQAYLGG